MASPPVIVSVTVTPEIAGPGVQRKIKVVATDPNNLPLTYQCVYNWIQLKPTNVIGEFVWNG